MATEDIKFDLNLLDWATRDTGFIPDDGIIWYYYNNSTYPNTIIYLIGDGTNTIENLTIYTPINDQVQDISSLKTFLGNIESNILYSTITTLQLEPNRGAVATDSLLYLFRNTSTSGSRLFRIFKGDGTATVMHEFNGDTGESVTSGAASAASYNSGAFRSLGENLQMDPYFGATTEDSLLYMFRNTNTSGTKRLRIFQGDGTSTISHDFDPATGDLDITGALSKGSGSFIINHPLESMSETHKLAHSFTESPYADNRYTGMVFLKKGRATINIDEHFGMTEGTFLALNTTLRRKTSNESGFTAVKSELNGNILSIIAEDPKCKDEVFWEVIGERHDKHMFDTSWTDANGRVIIEPLRDETLTKAKTRIKAEKVKAAKEKKVLAKFR